MDAAVPTVAGAETEAECTICSERYSAKARAPVPCSACHESACVRCVQQYLLTTLDDPQCMFCRRAWTDEFVRASLSATFVSSRLARHREQVLLDREKSMLPATQPFAERKVTLAKLHERVRDLEADKARIALAIRDTHVLIRNVNRDINVSLSDGTIATTTPSRLLPCPREDCRGFAKRTTTATALASGDAVDVYKCGLCETTLCPECNGVLDADPAAPAHVCDADTVNSLRLIAADSRPCPQCSVMIHRVTGCDQMFCTACHAPFHWRTGAVISHGRLHNPHYYEFLMQQRAAGGVTIGREHADVPCGGMPNSAEMHASLMATHACNNLGLAAAAAVVAVVASDGTASSSSSSTGTPTPMDSLLLAMDQQQQQTVYREATRRVMAFHQVIEHVNDVELNVMRDVDPQVVDVFQRNLDLRERFLMGYIDEVAFKRALLAREKAQHRRTAIRQVLTTLRDVGADQLRAVIVARCAMPVVLSTIRNMEALRVYVNEALRGVSKRFGNCAVLQIDERWFLVR